MTDIIIKNRGMLTKCICSLSPNCLMAKNTTSLLPVFCGRIISSKCENKVHGHYAYRQSQLKNPAIRKAFSFCTQRNHSNRNFIKHQFIENFGFNIDMDIAQFKDLPLSDKISIFLKLIKSNENPEIEIEELDKITKMKQVFIQQINKLEIQEQIRYFSYFISAYKLWLYRETWSSYQKKQVDLLEFRKLIPVPDEYFRNLSINTQTDQECLQMGVVIHLLVNFECVQQSQQQKILLASIPYLSKINIQNLCIFLADASHHDFNIPKQFFNALYHTTKIQNLEWPYIYYLFSFAQKYSTVYSPMINFHITNSRSRQIFESELTNVKQLLSFLKCLQIQYKLTNQAHLKSFNIHLFQILSSIQKLIQQKKYPVSTVIQIYNELADIYPIGTRYLREISLNKQAKYGNEHLPTIKKYILKNINNLKPNYIYSIDEKCVNQVSIPMLFLLQLLLKRVLLADPYFLLQISIFYATIGEKIRNPLNLTTNQVLGKIISEFIENNQSSNLRQMDQNKVNILMKIINFIYETKDNSPSYLGETQEIISYAQNYIKTIQSIPHDNLQKWIFVYRTISLTKKHQIQNYTNLCDKVCLTYIRQNSHPKSPQLKINQYKPHQQYILRIIYLLKKNPGLFTSSNRQYLTDFINNRFISSVKSIKKDGIFDILALFSSLPEIDMNILGYLYSNLSSFVMFTQVNKKFYLPRGPRSVLKEKFVQTLKQAIQHYKKLQRLHKKYLLNILKIIAVRFWNQLSNPQILKFLMIFNGPAALSNKLKQKLKQTNFILQDLKQITELEFLRPYRYHNPKLFKLISNQSISQNPNTKQYKQIQTYDLIQLNNKSSTQLSQIFMNIQFYEQVLEDARIKCQNHIPIPKTTDPKINMIYACLRVYGKIMDVFDYKINSKLTNVIKTTNNNKNLRYNINQLVNITEQLKFIQQRNLVRLDDLNQFKLGNIQISDNSAIIQGWYSYEAYDNLIEIQQYSNATTSDNTYEKVLLSLFGDTGYIRQYTRKQTFFSQPVFAALQLGLEADPKGSLIEITKDTNTIYLLCSDDTNYKIHTIFAYIFNKLGFTAHIVTQSHTRQEIKQFLKNQMDISEEYLNKMNTGNDDGIGANNNIINDDQEYFVKDDEKNGKSQKFDKYGKKIHLNKINELSDKTINMGD